jgi:hypothetical protein
MNKTPQTIAIEAALAADWERAHRIVQELNDPLGFTQSFTRWKAMPGNSHYYSRAGDLRYEDFADPRTELEAALTVASERR